MTSLILPGGDGMIPQRQLRGMARAFAADLARTGKSGQLVYTETTFARVYIYAGEFVADCPRPDCGNTVLMTIKRDADRGKPFTDYERLDSFSCGYCGYQATSVHWPPNYELLLDILDCRPIGHTRNWYPAGHVTAVKHGIPDGQTPKDLIGENTEHHVPTPIEIVELAEHLALEGGEPPRPGQLR